MPTNGRSFTASPGQEFNVVVITMPREEYEGFGSKTSASEAKEKLPPGKKLEFVRCYIDASNEQMIQTDYIRISIMLCHAGPG